MKLFLQILGNFALAAVMFCPMFLFILALAALVQPKEGTN